MLSLNYLILVLNILLGAAWNQGARFKHFGKTYPDEEIFKVGSATNSNSSVKKRLLSKGLIEYQCNSCGIAEWMDKPISLELNHINGINNDNSIPNLELLCPNCHSQTDNFRGRNQTSAKLEERKQRFLDQNIGFVPIIDTIQKEEKRCLTCDTLIKDHRNKYCSYECRNLAHSTVKITKEELLDALERFNTVQEVARHFKSAKPTVRNWFDKYDIDYSKIVKTNQWV